MCGTMAAARARAESSCPACDDDCDRYCDKCQRARGGPHKDSRCVRCKPSFVRSHDGSLESQSAMRASSESEDPGTPSLDSLDSYDSEAGPEPTANNAEPPSFPVRLGNGPRRDPSIRQPKTTKILADTDIQHLQACQRIIHTCQKIQGKDRARHSEKKTAGGGGGRPMHLPLLRPSSPQYERILASFHGVGGGSPQLHCRRAMLAPALPDVDYAIASKESELRATMGELRGRW